jgi:hypothetical protein
MTKREKKDLLHYIIGGLIGLCLGFTFSGGVLFERLFVGTLISTVLGLIWEWGWNAYNGNEIDKKDVWRAVIACDLVIFVMYLIL